MEIIVDTDMPAVSIASSLAPPPPPSSSSHKFAMELLSQSSAASYK